MACPLSSVGAYCLDPQEHQSFWQMLQHTKSLFVPYREDLNLSSRIFGPDHEKIGSGNFISVAFTPSDTILCQQILHPGASGS